MIELLVLFGVVIGGALFAQSRSASGTDARGKVRGGWRRDESGAIHAGYAYRFSLRLPGASPLDQIDIVRAVAQATPFVGRLAANAPGDKPKDWPDGDGDEADRWFFTSPPATANGQFPPVGDLRAWVWTAAT